MSIRSQITSYKKEIFEFGGKSKPQDDDPSQSITSYPRLKKSTKSLLDNSEGFLGKTSTREVSKHWLRDIGETEDGDKIDLWGPVVEVLSEEEMKKLKRLEDRKIRYEKRRR
jgi:hypothetical protein